MYSEIIMYTQSIRRKQMLYKHMDIISNNVHEHLWRYLELGYKIIILKGLLCFVQKHWRNKQSYHLKIIVALILQYSLR